MKRIFFLVIASSIYGHAAEVETSNIIITSKQNLKSSELQSDSLVLTSEDLDLLGVTTVAGALASIPGLELSQTGALAGESSIFIRGMGSAYTLILIDGIKVFDPTTPNRSFNLSILNTLNVERIEVLKGNQSVLYGSDAIGGVINIITQKGQNPKSYVKAGLGNFELLAINKKVQLSNSLLSLSGYSQQASGENDVEDGSEKDNKSLKGFDLTYLWSADKLSTETLYKKTHSYFDVDHYNSTTNSTEDDDYLYNETDHEFFHQRINYEFTKLNSLTIDLSHQKFNRWNKFLYNTTYTTYNYKGDINALEVRYNEFWNNNKFVLGLNASSERYQDDSTSSEYIGILEAFYNQQTVLNGIHYEIGTRGISNEDFGEHLITAIGAKKYLTHSIYTRASHKTGFKAPSLYQQKSPTGGNENLTPERSETIELSGGVEDKIWSYGSTLFYTEVNNQISYSNKYINDDFSITRGIELFSEYKWQFMSLQSNLTLLNLEKVNGKEQTRRPEYSMTQAVNWNIFKEDLLSIRWKAVGRRFDSKGTTEQVELHRYDLVDLSYSHKFEVGKVNFQLNNIFDQSYELARGYRTLGTNLQVDLIYNY